ncbi:hypothetical protein GCM10011452_13550 [Gemmobacter lanyuensis]|uniref:Uncharacterized protein n=1 Tax=Gemmobacter lanyuensis TaxID=1054497 RepID=A0A918MHN6_9RHOB|nr:hypothetical protein GCM10011452_13550 [Gemmobacter lanyuensis]
MIITDFTTQSALRYMPSGERSCASGKGAACTTGSGGAGATGAVIAGVWAGAGGAGCANALPQIITAARTRRKGVRMAILYFRQFYFDSRDVY